LVCAVGYDPANNTATAANITASAGWTAQADVASYTAVSPAVFIKLFYAQGGASAPTITFAAGTTGNSGQTFMAQILSFTGVALDTPFGTSGTAYNAASATNTSIGAISAPASMTAGSLALGAGIRSDDSATAATFTTGWTIAGADINGTAGADAGMYQAYWPVVGATQPTALTISSLSSLATTRAGRIWWINPATLTTTATARVSLGSIPTPNSTNFHSLGVTARTTDAKHGTIRMQLYEGATARSAEYETSALTSTLANYTLPLTSVEAAAITSHSDLEVRFRGTSVTGQATAFEVAEVWLQTEQGTAVSVTPRRTLLGVG
jgi:hypothetical protein